jgi:hypothetical protein
MTALDPFAAAGLGSGRGSVERNKERLDADQRDREFARLNKMAAAERERNPFAAAASKMDIGSGSWPMLGNHPSPGGSSHEIISGPGKVYIAPVGTPAPTLGDAAVAPWEELGTMAEFNSAIATHMSPSKAWRSSEQLTVIADIQVTKSKPHLKGFHFHDPITVMFEGVSCHDAGTPAQLLLPDARLRETNIAGGGFYAVEFLAFDNPQMYAGAARYTVPNP